MLLSGEDFTIQKRIPLIFSPEVERLPVPFNILSDEISEGTESFSLSLAISDNVPGGRLDFENAATTIFINDDDGKLRERTC